MGGQRDRRGDGRPEQSRPRDRSGRPLAYGVSDVPLAEEHDPVTVEEALELGKGLWNQQRFFEAHECLEAVWHASPSVDRDLWQGVIQVAVAEVHRQRGNPSGAATLCRRAETRLRAYPEQHRGIDVAAALGHCGAVLAEILSTGVDAALPAPAFPETSGGAWFTPDPSALRPPDVSTPVPTEPVWVTAGERRAPQRLEDRPPQEGFR